MAKSFSKEVAQKKSRKENGKQEFLLFVLWGTIVVFLYLQFLLERKNLWLRLPF